MSRTVKEVVGWTEPERVDLTFAQFYAHLQQIKIISLGLRDEKNWIYRDSVISRAIYRELEIPRA